MPRADMSDRHPLVPSTPQLAALSSVCLACAKRLHHHQRLTDRAPIGTQDTWLSSDVINKGCTLSDVSTRMVDAPQFWIRVLGITSSAWATARYGHCSTPVSARERSIRRLDTAISTAPPPGSRCGSSSTLRHTCMPSCRFLSTS